VRRDLRMPFTVLATSTSVVLVVVACASSEEPAAPLNDDASVAIATDASHDDSSLVVDDSGSTADAGLDVDAAPPVCTTEGWCHTVVPRGQTFVDVWGDGTGKVWAISQGQSSGEGKIFFWDGAAWTLSYAATADLYALWGNSPTDLWVGTSKGLLHGTGPSATAITWTEATLPVVNGTNLYVRSIWGSGPNDTWAVGARIGAGSPTYVLHRSGPAADPDAGTTEWVIDTSPELSSVSPLTIWGSSSDDVWLNAEYNDASGVKGRLLRRRPDGTGTNAWRVSTDLPEVNSWFTGQALGKNFALINSASGYGNVTGFDLGVSNDDGDHFTWRHLTLDTLPYSAFKKASVVWASGPNDIWAIATTAVGSTWLVQLKDPETSSWRVASISLSDAVPVTRKMNAIWGSGPNDIWVVGNELALHKVDPSKGAP